MNTLKSYAVLAAFILAVNAGIYAGQVSLGIPFSASAGQAAVSSVQNLDFADDVSAAADSAPAIPAFCHDFKANIQLGDRGAEVAALQNALERSHILVTGSERSGKMFGQATLAAAKRFQQKGGLTQSGFVGAQTRAKLNAAYQCAAPAAPLADRQADAIALPSAALVQGKNIVYEEKITGIAAHTTLGIETFSVAATGAKLSGFQLSVFATKDFSGSSRFFSPSAVSATSTSFDLTGIPLAKGQYAYLQLVANANVTSNDAYATIARGGSVAAALSGGQNPGKAWSVERLSFPYPIYAGADFTIDASFKNQSGLQSLEAFIPELRIRDSAGKLAYDYVQPNSGKIPLGPNALGDIVFGTVSGGAALQAMIFPAGHYSATVSFSDIAHASSVLGSLSQEFDVVAPPASYSAGTSGASSGSAAVSLGQGDPLDADSAAALLADWSGAASDYHALNQSFGPAVSSCAGGIFADPIGSDIMANLLQAGEATVICRADPVSYALSIQVSPDDAPVCADGLGYVGPGKVDTSGAEIAYCLRGYGKFAPAQ